MYVYKSRVTASQTGADGRQSTISALNMMQDCSQLWMESEYEYEKYFRENRITQVIVSRQADFVDLARYGEKLVTKTSVFECKDCLGYRNTAIYREDGSICAKSWSVGAFISLDTGRMVRLPEYVTEQLTYDLKIDMDYLDRRIKLPEKGFKEGSEILVKSFDIDINRHVNNVRYIQMALEALPEDFSFNRLRVEYRIAAKLHEKIYPFISNFESEKIYVKLCNEEGKPYSIIEFSNYSV